MTQVEAASEPAADATLIVRPEPPAEPLPVEAEPAPKTLLMPQVASVDIPPPLAPQPQGPGGTVQLLRPEDESVVPRPSGGTVPVRRGARPEPSAASPAGAEAPAPNLRGGTVPVLRPTAPEARPPSVPPAPVRPAEPAAPVETAPRTVVVPVEELSRLAELPADAPLPQPDFSTRLMPQQPAPAPPATPPPALPTMAVPARQAPVEPAGALRPEPAAAPRSGWKLWAGLGGMAVLVTAGLILWLRPELVGAGGGGRPLSFPLGGDAPARPVPASLKSYKDKADAGDASAMRFLGACYANGLLGAPRDLEEAKRWYRKAAEAGSQAAREELANLQRQER